MPHIHIWGHHYQSAVYDLRPLMRVQRRKQAMNLSMLGVLICSVSVTSSTHKIMRTGRVMQKKIWIHKIVGTTYDRPAKTVHYAQT